jgi:hypothetical protein
MGCSRAVFPRAAADQREDAEKMSGEGQAESSGGSAGSAGAPVSRHAGAAGKAGGRLISMRMRRTLGNRKMEPRNCEEKTPLMLCINRAAGSSVRATRYCSTVNCRSGTIPS